MEGNECGSYMLGGCGKEGKGNQEMPWPENMDWDIGSQYNHTSLRQAWMESSRRWLKTLENRHQQIIDGEGDGDGKKEGGRYQWLVYDGRNMRGQKNGMQRLRIWIVSMERQCGHH